MKKDKIYYLENADYAKWLYAGLAIYCSIEITWLVCFMTGIRASQLAVISLAMCPAFYYLLSQQLFLGKRESASMWILSILIAASIPLGAFLDNNVSLQSWTAYIFIEWMLCVGGMIPLVFCLIRILLSILEKVKPSGHSAWFIKKPVLYYFLVFFVMILCWLPVWLAYFPGLWNYDPWQVTQVINNSYSTHYPLIHTLLLGACYMFGNVCGNVNLGVALYDWIQMVVMAAIFSYTVLFIRRKTDSRILCAITVFFYGMFPVNSIMVISSTKDVLFSGLVLLCSVFALQYKDIVGSPVGGGKQKKEVSHYYWFSYLFCSYDDVSQQCRLCICRGSYS